ncbi:molybdopterin-dependent oxidoreductase [Actinoplanes sp. NPDC049548]|uniref:molybdopterin-dependent oxidoreductase n=1 Tax=Actinoplanes sp. NPDC049548 TaxID=3155152 RepID=UPI0034438DD1
MVRILGKALKLPGLVRPQVFDSELRSTRLTSQLGIALGVAFMICFFTGVISHLIQHPPGWFSWPSRPAGLYRLTQGLHVVTGLAFVPLLGAKLWSVYPRLFQWPPLRSIGHAIERASIAVLVAAALFQVVGGVLNISRWYGALPYFFTTGHYWVAWLTVGALLTHIGVKLPLVRDALARSDAIADKGGLSRRGFLATVASAGAVITVATVGQTVSPLARVSVLAPRRPTVGPQRLPVNKTAAGAAVAGQALDPSYRLVVAGPEREVRLSVTDLRALPQHTVILPIACVEGWSANGTWTGVRLRDLADLVGAHPQAASAEIESLEQRGRYRRSHVPSSHLADALTLIALELNGAVLHLDHGYPARLIAPNRPGVLQTKWISRISIRNGS